jgi:hypothetical protein
MFSDKGFCHENDFKCLENASRFEANGFFSVCNDGSVSPCIEGLEGRSSDSSDWIRGSIISQVSFVPDPVKLEGFAKGISEDLWGGKILGLGDGGGWSANRSLGLFASGPGPVNFKIPGVKNAAGTDTYTVDSRFKQNFTISSSEITGSSLRNIYMNIRPYIDAGPSYTPMQAFRNGGPTGSLGVTGSHAFKTDEASGLAAAFDEKAEYRLTVRMPKTVAGWFHGRLTDPKISIDSMNETMNRISVGGKSVIAPITSFGWASYFDPAAVKFRSENNIGSDPNSEAVFRQCENLPTPCSMGGGPSWSPDSGIDMIYKQWESLLAPAAKGQVSVWSLSTLSLGSNPNPCLTKSDALQGIITTNAMAYQGGLPEFKEGTLNYSVAGVHFDPNNKVFHGTYDLIMRSEAARCLYGFSSAPISAAIEVIDGDGSADIAVTSFGEKDGWITLAAHNFTFSNPRISVKLSGEKLAPPVVVKPSPIISKPTIKTIICVSKKKPTKTITVKAVAPKCPTGYVIKPK